MADRVVTQVRPRTVLLPKTKPVFEKRVAAYARVSTASDEQMGSVEAQKDYFQKLITERPGWVLVDIYADEGISGTSLTRREAFNRMIDDALAGKIDMIITKSLSRFARNTIDTLNTIRKLKVAGIGVYFEKEDIDTLDAKGEFLITLMSSLAEEESRSISENVKWGIRKRFADGKYSMPYKQFLGYNKSTDGNPVLVESEARIIRLIYRLFLLGDPPTVIARKLSNAGIPTPAGLQVWQHQTIESILRNEKYHGAALLQKTFCVDFRTHQQKPNRGELPKYYVENAHEPIVTKEIFDEVQRRLVRPEQRNHSNTLFANLLYCKDCGGLLTAFPAHSTTYNDILWRCANLRQRSSSCTTPTLYEELLVPIFHEVIISVLNANAGIVRECVTALKSVCSVSSSLTKKKIIDSVAAYTAGTKAEQQLWRSVIQKVVVHTDYLLEFHILDDTVIPYQMLITAPRQRRLTQAAKAMILLRHEQGHKPADIANSLNLPADTIRSLIHRTYGSKTPRTTICQNCGCTFPIQGKKERKYCSQACYRSARFSTTRT